MTMTSTRDVRPRTAASLPEPVRAVFACVSALVQLLRRCGLEAICTEYGLGPAVRVLWLALFLGTMAALEVSAGTLEGGAAVGAGENRSAFHELRRKAEAGDAGAQWLLGTFYWTGYRVAKDDREAVAWYRRAAEQGLAGAQFNLGVMYAGGSGVVQDDREAIAWFRKAASQGLPEAQYNLGIMYDNGRGVAKDEREAAAWYRKAAEQGDAKAQFNLGLSYANGEGVAKDQREAAAWFRKAAEQGYTAAQNSLGWYYESGTAVLQDFREAANWYRKAATAGNAFGQRNLGRLYRDGEGVQKDLVAAYAWLNLAAAAGHPDAPRERNEVAQELSREEIVLAQKLAADWKPGTLIPETPRPSTARRTAIPTALADARTEAAKSQGAGPYPAAPPKRAGVVSCSTNCRNGDCYRTYDDGRRVRFQANQRWNQLENRFDWDSGSC